MDKNDAVELAKTIIEVFNLYPDPPKIVYRGINSDWSMFRFKDLTSFYIGEHKDMPFIGIITKNTSCYWFGLYKIRPLLLHAERSSKDEPVSRISLGVRYEYGKYKLTLPPPEKK